MKFGEISNLIYYVEEKEYASSRLEAYFTRS